MNCAYAPLSGEALLHIEGPDSLTFLQGQTTCDTREVTSEQAQLGVYCSPKGRVVCDFLLGQLAPEHVALRMRRDIVNASAAVFGKYIVFSKADLNAERDDWQVFGLWGKDAAAAVATVFGGSPQGHLQVHARDGLCVTQLDAQGQRFECWLHTEVAASSMQQLQTNAELQVEAAWQALDVAAGIARIESPTVEEFVPQVLNYDLTGHISFTKGCYTGQEVVARLHYLGKSKRRTYLARMSELAAPGTAVFAAANDRSIGEVINCIAVNGQYEGLVSTTGEARELRVGSPGGPSLVMENPPYPLAKE